MLALQVRPLIAVDKSPSIVYDIDYLQRAHKFFPQARFIHLLRHPRGHGESIMKYITETAKHGPVPPWLLALASFPNPVAGAKEPQNAQSVDPQYAWFVLNTNICEFLKSIPDEQKMEIRGEDLLNSPDQGLRRIADWLELRTDDEAIEEMKHPERSPYACFGPPGARLGNDLLFIENPALRALHVESHTLSGPLSWRDDGHGFGEQVENLARRFGYE
jgi:hypothetical protein